MRLRALHSDFSRAMQHPRHALYAAWHSTLERHHEGTVSWVDIYDKSVKRPKACNMTDVDIVYTSSPGTHYITAIGRKSGDAAQKAFTVSTNWSEFHFGTGRKGFNPYENVIDAANVSDLDIAWQTTTGSPIESSPAVANGVVYVGSDDDKLYAYHATTGALLWSATTGSYVTSSPAVANGVVYVGSDDDKLYAYHATTGALLWSATTGSAIFSSPAVANGVVYVGSFDDNLYAYNATTGALLWSATTGSRYLFLSRRGERRGLCGLR
jgi:outer membrane protein assembly factor BamB